MKLRMKKRLALFLITAVSLTLPALQGAVSAQKNKPGLSQSFAKKKKAMSLTNSKQGHSCIFVDVDGDDLEDLLVGAPGGASSSFKKGAVLVYSRKSARLLSPSHSVLAEGEQAGDQFGNSMVNLGDVDGDGKADFAVGAWTAEGKVPLSGAFMSIRAGKVLWFF